MRDLRLLHAAIARREQEEKAQRGVEMPQARGGAHGGIFLQERCAVCNCRLRENQFGHKWCTQTFRHKALS